MHDTIKNINVTNVVSELHKKCKFLKVYQTEIHNEYRVREKGEKNFDVNVYTKSNNGTSVWKLLEKT